MKDRVRAFYTRIATDLEAERIGKLMFLYRTTYGLSKRDIVKEVGEAVGSKEYGEYINKAVDEAVRLHEQWAKSYSS